MLSCKPSCYPENIKNNIDPIIENEVDFIHPFLSFKNEETIAYRLFEELGSKFSLSKNEIYSAVHDAWTELASCREDMRRKGEETIRFLNETGNRGIVFSNTMQDLTRQTRGKGRRQSIFYQFSVVGKNDTYKLSIDIRHDGTCYLFINSLKRSPISYTGQIVEQG